MPNTCIGIEIDPTKRCELLKAIEAMNLTTLSIGESTY